MFAPVYFDHNATTAIAPDVLEAMLPYLTQRFGNASSRHEYGRAARRAIDEARQQVAAAVGAHPSEVVFTSGGSEANNLFIKGAAACLPPGVVDGEGRIDADAYAEALSEGPPRLISVMLANNETGVLQDVGALAEAARPARPWFHTDAVQALGKVAVDFRALNSRGVHAMTLSGHKIGGPKGAAALVLDKRLELQPVIAGGGQERGLRSGTENVAAIVGFAAACAAVTAAVGGRAKRLVALRGEIERGLSLLGATIFGAAAERLPNTSYFALPDIDGETLVAKLDRAGFAVASGAACSSAAAGPSHVLMAMGVAPELARGAVRVSLGPASTAREVADFLETLADVAQGLKRMNALAG